VERLAFRERDFHHVLGLGAILGLGAGLLRLESTPSVGIAKKLTYSSNVLLRTAWAAQSAGASAPQRIYPCRLDQQTHSPISEAHLSPLP
jgi:hypothetical protein